jgi:hypothetical protein
MLPANDRSHQKTPPDSSVQRHGLKRFSSRYDGKLVNVKANHVDKTVL